MSNLVLLSTSYCYFLSLKIDHFKGQNSIIYSPLLTMKYDIKNYNNNKKGGDKSTQKPSLLLSFNIFNIHHFEPSFLSFDTRRSVSGGCGGCVNLHILLSM